MSNNLLAGSATANPFDYTDHYNYDNLSRLKQWSRIPDNIQVATDGNIYTYDKVGNRTSEFKDGRTYHYAGAEGTTNAERANMLGKVKSNNNSYLALAEYNRNGDMILRDKKVVEGEIVYHAIEEFVYNSRGNPFKYRRRHLSVMDTSVVCAPDASEAPVTEWQYRYAPHQEREQKRQYSSASTEELAWIYYLIAPNKKSLSKWHGMEGMNCDSSPTVTLWPVEYNTYGPNSVRILTRPDGSREYPICDYLGSVRFTLHESSKTVERRTYEPFGSTTSREGEGAGTAYTGVETDAESDLGFHGVRWYDSDWGRFLSVDKLRERHYAIMPYHYVLNRPLDLVDPSGLDSIQRASAVEKARAYIESESSYMMGAKGDPGKPVDCSGLVSKCIRAGGEPDPNNGDEGSGVLNIEKNSEKKMLADVNIGDIVTFRNDNPGKYPYHAGIVTGVQYNDKGEVSAIEVTHSSSRANGPTKQIINPLSDSTLGKRIRVAGIYKWDTKPDIPDNESPDSAPSTVLPNSEQ